MEKTKLGLSTALLGAVAYLACYYGGITATLLIVGAILILESNEELKKNALRAALLVFTFTVLSSVIYLLPNLISCISSVLSIFTINFDLYIITRIASVLTTILDFIEKIVFLGLAFLTLVNTNVKIPVVDGLIEKHYNK